MSNSIPLSQPDITDLEIRYVTDTLRSGRLALGPRMAEFEEMVAMRAARTHGIAVNSGTSGLQLALLALGVGPGDEVITPAFSFVASANCILHVGATPVFADCDPGTLNVRPESIEDLITEKTKAIIAVDVFGNPAYMAEIEALANRHEIALVEDCCEGLGGAVKNRPIGSFGRVGVFSFYPNKQVTTGEGGVIVTDDDALAGMCRSLRNQGRAADNRESGPGLGSWLVHERVGYNYRMCELQAALGVAQMERLDEIIDTRHLLAEKYNSRLVTNPDLILPTIERETRMSWFVYVVRLNDQFTGTDRDEIIAGLRRHEIGASNYFPPIPLLPFFRRTYGYKPGDFPMAETMSQRTIALPFYNAMTDYEVDLVCQTLELMITRVTFSRS